LKKREAFGDEDPCRRLLEAMAWLNGHGKLHHLDLGRRNDADASKAEHDIRRSELQGWVQLGVTR
jgi:hypothetical protein